MFKEYIKTIGVLLFLCIFSTLFSQNVGINTTGTNPSINAILDLNSGNSNNLGLIVPNVTLGALLTTFNPPMANAPTAADIGMMVFNAHAPQTVGYYYWNGVQWVSVSGGVATILADNGLSVGSFTAGNVELGGTTAAPSGLVGNSVISGKGFSLDFDLGTYTAPGTGSFLVTNGGVGTPLLSVTSNTPGVGINVNPAVSTLDDNGSFGAGIFDLTPAPAPNSSTPLTSAYSTVIATPPAVGNTYTLTLPSATADPRQIYTVVYNGSGTGTIDVTSPVAGNIMEYGAVVNPLALTSGGSFTLQSDGANWNIISAPANLGQYTSTVTSTAAAGPMATLTWYAIPGLTQTFTLTDASNVVLSTQGVIETTNTGNCQIQIDFLVDGTGYFVEEAIAPSDSHYTSNAGLWSGTENFPLAAGAHTVQVWAIVLTTGGAPGNITCGGAVGSVAESFLTVAALHN